MAQRAATGEPTAEAEERALLDRKRVVDRAAEPAVRRRRQPQRPLSPAPEAVDFETEDDFLRERARWFREHGDGSELYGTRREQNTFFQRLKDRVFSLRRDRANPSGTPRAVREAASR